MAVALEMHYSYYELVEQPQYFIDNLYAELERRHERITNSTKKK